MRKNKFKILISMLCIIFFSTNIIFAEGNTITKTNEYIGNKGDVKAEKKITENGKEYRLKVVTEDEQPFEIKKKVTKDDKGEYPKEITYKFKGKTYTLKVLKEEFKEAKETKEEYIEYQNRADIKQSIVKDNLTYSLDSISQKSRSEQFKAPALFIKYSLDSNEYIFNGKKVVISGDPLWSGYESDIKDYLGINGNNYQITGGRFTTDDILVDEIEERYERRAEYYGNKIVPFFTVKYVNEKETEEGSKGEVTYGIKGAKKISQTLIYEEVEKKLTLKEILAYGAGILVISLGIGYILYILAKKNKKRKEEE